MAARMFGVGDRSLIPGAGLDNVPASRSGKPLHQDEDHTILIAAVSGVLRVQVKTNVPDVVAGARPAVVERIRIHGQALEGNLAKR